MGNSSFTNVKEPGFSNPRPGVAIATIDMLPGKDNAGVPALLALTAAQAE